MRGLLAEPPARILEFERKTPRTGRSDHSSSRFPRREYSSISSILEFIGDTSSSMPPLVPHVTKLPARYADESRLQGASRFPLAFHATMADTVLQNVYSGSLERSDCRTNPWLMILQDDNYMANGEGILWARLKVILAWLGLSMDVMLLVVERYTKLWQLACSEHATCRWMITRGSPRSLARLISVGDGMRICPTTIFGKNS